MDIRKRGQAGAFSSTRLRAARRSDRNGDSPYERPEHAEIRIDTTVSTPDSAADVIMTVLEQRGVLDSV